MGQAEKLPEVVTENNIVSIDQSPLAAAERLLSAGADLDKIEKMLELQERFGQMEAKKAYTQAMADFKANPPQITRDKKNLQYNSKYTSLGNLVNSALPQMSKCGLSHKWEINQSQQITVTCVVTHHLGHSESTSMTAPPDGSGKKNPIQQIKSTITYLKAATFESIMGLASTDANLDDDGNASNIKYIDEKQVSQITDMINTIENFSEASFLSWAKIESVEMMPAYDFGKCMNALKAKAKAGQK